MTERYALKGDAGYQARYAEARCMEDWWQEQIESLGWTVTRYADQPALRFDLLAEKGTRRVIVEVKSAGECCDPGTLKYPNFVVDVPCLEALKNMDGAEIVFGTCHGTVVPLESAVWHTKGKAPKTSSEAWKPDFWTIPFTVDGSTGLLDYFGDKAAEVKSEAKAYDWDRDEWRLRPENWAHNQPGSTHGPDGPNADREWLAARYERHLAENPGSIGWAPAA